MIDPSTQQKFDLFNKADLNLFNQRMAEYLVLYVAKAHINHSTMTPKWTIFYESKNCVMWWTHTIAGAHDKMRMIHRTPQCRGKAR